MLQCGAQRGFRFGNTSSIHQSETETLEDYSTLWLREALKGCAWHVHTPEGALFLWLWLPQLAITSAELYLRLKARGVLVLSGHHFFPGLDESPQNHWSHRDQCLRVTYARDEDTVRRGIAILGDEVRRWQR